MWNITQNIKIAQDIQKHYADNKRTHKEFNIGEHVYLRVKPRKSTLGNGTSAKLAPHFYGPYKILDRVGPVAYQLALPRHIKVYNVFQMSL